MITIRKLRELMHSSGSGRRQPLRLPGLRIIKTSLAVLLCLLFYALVPLPATFKVVTALVAAIISLRSTIQESFAASLTRIQSTFVGAVFGFAVLLTKDKFGMDDRSMIYALVLSLGVVLVMWISVSFFKETGAGLGAIVFLAIALGLSENVTPFQLAVARFLDTLIGIVIALVINRVLPFPPEEGRAD